MPDFLCFALNEQLDLLFSFYVIMACCVRIEHRPCVPQLCCVYCVLCIVRLLRMYVCFSCWWMDDDHMRTKDLLVERDVHYFGSIPTQSGFPGGFDDE